MTIDREYTLTELANLPPDERLRALRHRIATKEYEEQDYTFESADEPPSKQVLHLYFTEEEIALLYRLLDEKERQARAIIQRNADYPTYNTRAVRSNNKQEALIQMIESIRSKITDQ